MKTTFPFLLIMTLLATLSGSVFADDTVYRWVDSNGMPHFGKQPPEGVSFTVFEPKIMNTIDGGRNEHQESEPESESPDNKNDEYDEQLNKLASRQQEACRKATENKERLLNNHRIQMKDADGTVRTLSHEEKLEQIKRADSGIQEYCKK